MSLDRALLKAFWSCGDNEIIEFAIQRARLNKKEKDVIFLLMDECFTQEQASEELGISPRKLQDVFYSAIDKLLSIKWVYGYANYIKNQEDV